MARVRNNNFGKYVASVLQDSMLTGIPQIAVAKNIPSKMVRSVVFVLCVAGFTYQALEYMDVYWRFETVLDIRVENPRTAVMPSWTVCTNNALNTSKVCHDPEWNKTCLKVRDDHTRDWCKCLPRFCRDGQPNDITIPDFEGLQKLAYSEYEVYKPFLVPFRYLVAEYYCVNEFERTDKATCGNTNHINIGCISEKSHELHACYTLHTLLDKPDEEHVPVSSQLNEYMMLYTMPDEYNLNAREVMIYLSIHSPWTVLNPTTYGETLRLGYITVFHLRKTLKSLLPPPYETNCMDYLALWKARGGRGPTTEREKDTVQLIADDCALKNCRPACFEEIYETRRTTYAMDFGTYCSDGTESVQDYAGVNLKLDGMQTTSYIYSPKYQPIEIFSYVGGYIGMWLGISLVAVFDFFETLALLMRYPLHRWTRRRAKRRRVGHIEHSRTGNCDYEAF